MRDNTIAWFVLSLFYKLVDVVSTLYIISHSGIGAEDNPIVHGMLRAYGPVFGLIINAAIFSLLMWALHKHREKTLLKVATFMQMAVAIITTSAIYIN